MRRLKRSEARFVRFARVVVFVVVCVVLMFVMCCCVGVSVIKYVNEFDDKFCCLGVECV